MRDTFLVTTVKTCRNCGGKGKVPQIGRPGKPTFLGRFEMCIACLGKGTVRAEASLLAALTEIGLLPLIQALALSVWTRRPARIRNPGTT